MRPLASGLAPRIGRQGAGWGLSMHGVNPPDQGEDWLALTDAPLPIEVAAAWATRPDCGAVVVFAGTVRDHADGRQGVSALAYEAYEEEVVPRLGRLAEEARRRWPAVGRVVLWHRTGSLALSETSVVVAVSTPHRAEAFEAAAWCIDTLKETVPIWKHETWADGSGWGTGAHPVTEVAQ